MASKKELEIKNRELLELIGTYERMAKTNKDSADRALQRLKETREALKKALDLVDFLRADGDKTVTVQWHVSEWQNADGSKDGEKWVTI